MYRIHLSEDQLQELKRRTARRATAPRTRDRFEMVRLSHAGWSIPRIARHLRIYEEQVRYWVKRFLTGGFEALPDQPHLGQKSALTPEILVAVKEELRKGQRIWTAQEIADWIAQNHGVRRSARQARRMLRRVKVSYKRTHRHLKHKQKPAEVAAKKAELAALEKRGIGSARSVSPRRSRFCADAADRLQLVAGGRAAERGV